MAAPTLSADQQRRTLKASSQKKSIVRATLATPYKTSWPKLNNEFETLILDAINSTFRTQNLGRLGEVKYPEEVKTKNDRQKYKRKMCHEHWKNGIDKRKNFVFGINAVTRALEKDQLAAAVVCRDVVPEFMVQFLIPLCATRNVAAVAIHGLGVSLKASLHFKSCRAMGLKREVEDASHFFHPLYKVIQSHAISLSNGLVEVAVNIQNLLDTSVEQIRVAKAKNEEQSSSDSDYSHLYVYKDMEAKAKTSIQQKAPDFIALPSIPELDSSRDHSTDKVSIKTTESSVKLKDKPCTQKLKYHNLNIKRVFPNKNKKRKKQRTK